jgi:putative ABC transport system permease protein
MQIGLFFQYILSALQELIQNKLRTFLSLLGVSIGVFCIVGVYTMVDSLKVNIQDNLDSFGNDVLYVNKFAWMPEDGEKEYPFWKYKSRPQCKYRELVQLKEKVPTIAYGSMLYNTQGSIKFLDQSINATINAANYDIVHMQNLPITKGRFFTPNDMSSSNSSVIIGASLQEKLFAGIEPIGKSIKILGRPYTVIGIVKKQGQGGGVLQMDNAVLISYLSLMSFKNLEDDKMEFEDNTIILQPKKGYQVKEMKLEVKGALRAIRRIPPKAENSFSFNLLSNIKMQVESIFGMVNAVGFCIGLLSLLVGAFGIANIMFVVVKERTPQIGLKKAIGATRLAILFEFLTEAIVLCLLGGLIGIGLVALLAKIVSTNFEFPVQLRWNNFLVGIFISVLVGVLSGITPAIRASRMNPVVAIRS